MSDALIFQNNAYLGPILVGALLLWGLFVWKEWPTVHRGRRYVKIGLALLVVTALAMIALKPATQSTVSMGSGILVTDGFDGKILDSLKSLHPGTRVLRYSENRSRDPMLDSISSVFVLGTGLKPYDFWQVAGLETVYLGGAAPQGIIKLRYPQENDLGARWHIGGKVNMPKPGNRLVLHGPGGAGLDSLTFSTASSGTFSLSTTLKAAGKFLYALEEKDSLGNSLRTDPLPVTVRIREPLELLIINDFPTFETKYLKNYLAEMGHRLMIRSRLTQGKYKFEYFNRKKTPLFRLSAAALENFDVLLMDSPSYYGLSENERRLLLKSVEETGLGLFLQPDEQFFKQANGSLPFEFKGGNRTKTRLEFLPKVDMEAYPYAFQDATFLEAIQIAKGEILAAYRPMGLGRVGTSVLENTYQLLLDGHPEAYQNLWASIFNALGKKKEPLAEWEQNEPFPLANEPMHFKLRTSLPKPDVRDRDGLQIPMMQDFDLPTLWIGTRYPRENGWHSLRIQGDSTAVLHYFVTDSLAWRSLRTQGTLEANRRHFEGRGSPSKKTTSWNPIPPFWFYLVVLVGMGYLWFEPKLYGV